MADAALNLEVADFLYREALCLDERRWDHWLGLFATDAVFWVPSYTMGGEAVTDPRLSANLIYLSSRSSLEDRIFRLETEDSLASTPLPHTCHMITNVRAGSSDEEGAITATAAFLVAIWSFKRGPESRRGRYEYQLRREDGDFQIARKKVLLLDQVIDGWFDIFSV